MSTATRSEFKNVSGGILGVVTIDGRGDRQGLPVKPGDSIWLTKEEEIATANAPRRPEDNPFHNGALILVTAASEVENRRPIGSTGPVVEDVVEPEPEVVEPPRVERAGENDDTGEEVGAPPLPEGDPEHGIRAPGEEVGTPQAVAQAARKTPQTRGQTVRSGNPAARPAHEPGKPQGVVVTPNGPTYAEAK